MYPARGNSGQGGVGDSQKNREYAACLGGRVSPGKWGSWRGLPTVQTPERGKLPAHPANVSEHLLCAPCPVSWRKLLTPFGPSFFLSKMGVIVVRASWCCREGRRALQARHFIHSWHRPCSASTCPSCWKHPQPHASWTCRLHGNCRGTSSGRHSCPAPDRGPSVTPPAPGFSLPSMALWCDGACWILHLSICLPLPRAPQGECAHGC